MDHQTNKAHRLKQIEALLLSHKEGLTISQIAKKLDVNRSTVWHYYNDADLPHTHYELGEDGRIRLNPEGLRFNVQLDLHEALALHLAVRLLSTRMDRHNPNAASAIRKISQAIERMAPTISQSMAKSADSIDATDQLQDPTYIEVLKGLTKAWANSSCVKLWYQHDRSGEIREYTFCPYFIEPYAVGQTTYAIGQLYGQDAYRTFKIERITRLEILTMPYTIPPDFDPQVLLKDAWGIWFTREDPTPIVLRFDASVSRRVQESRWHRSQSLEMQPDGSLIWRADIAEWKEMLPWIKGWGANVEVLAPEELRRLMTAEAQQMASLYSA